MRNPYQSLPSSAFWRSAVADTPALKIGGLWDPKHELLPNQKVATAGSCFAQHIGRALAARGYNWFNAEPAPPQLSDELKRAFNFGTFSFRTGNIYTAALLKQWVSWSLGLAEVPDEIWEEEGHFFDPFRPNIEPEGFESKVELLQSRAATLRAVRRVIEEARVFVFTLGLTEAWANKAGGYVYPMCPGTLHGQFDPVRHEFRNFRYVDIVRDIRETFDIIAGVNKSIRFLLTVSPVPLTATASDNHVLVATTYSKSTLRAAAGDLATHGDTDYFPSYEIITGIPFRSRFFEPNLRSVSQAGVDFVMDMFFQCLHGKHPVPVPETAAATPRQGPGEGGRRRSGRARVECEEELLQAFGPRTEA